MEVGIIKDVSGMGIMPQIMLSGLTPFPAGFVENGGMSLSNSLGQKIITGTIQLEAGSSICEFQEIDNRG